MASSDPINCARRLAVSEAGCDIYQQFKLTDGMWFFFNGRHGYLVADIDSHPELAEWKRFVPIANRGSRAFTGYEREQHFAGFDGLDVSVPLALNFDAIATVHNYRLSKRGRWPFTGGGTYTEWRATQARHVNEDLATWHSDLLDSGRVHLVA